ncbi:MAG: ATP-binding protein [archaeon]|nr:ATP-binding protein [archaeon]
MDQIHDKDRTTLLFMVGLPGSGKTTWARAYAEEFGFTVRSSDDVRRDLYGDETVQGDSSVVFSVLHSLIERDLSKGRNVIMDTTGLTPRSREAIRRFRGLGATCIAVVLDVPDGVCIERNRSRERVVPDEAMERMMGTRDAPRLSEGFDRIVRVVP